MIQNRQPSKIIAMSADRKIWRELFSCAPRKQDYRQRVTNNYGTANAAIFIKSIENLEEVVGSNVKKV